MNLLAVILAGGEGRRMGGDKPLCLLAGCSLLDRAIAQARQWSDRPAISVRTGTQSQGLPSLIDEPDVEGPLGGLISALRFAKAEQVEAVLTIPADMPFLPEDLTKRLEGALGNERAAIAASGGYLHPVCGLWLTSTLDFVADYLATGRRSLKGFAEAVGYVAVDWPSDTVDPFFNINTPADLAAAERRLQG